MNSLSFFLNNYPSVFGLIFSAVLLHFDWTVCNIPQLLIMIGSLGGKGVEFDLRVRRKKIGSGDGDRATMGPGQLKKLQ